MAPCTTTLTLVAASLIVGIGGRVGESIRVQLAHINHVQQRSSFHYLTQIGGKQDGGRSSCCLMASIAPVTAINPAERRRRRGVALYEKCGPSSDDDTDARGSGAPASSTSAADGAWREVQQVPTDSGELSQDERLHQEVFANEKGFMQSTMFNPTRAKEQAKEEEVSRLATEWGSTVEKTKEIVDKTSRENELSFEELERIAEELKMTDAQQRSFMLKSSMRKLDDATKLPPRESSNPVEALVAERVFAGETGYLNNSKEFKDRLKAGSGVRFDAQGLPALENDPVIEAARKKAKNRTVSTESVKFPTLPDCPSCSTPTTLDELARFAMCSQCKANRISASAYGGPAVASRYTYDNHEAPFSSSWTDSSRRSSATAAHQAQIASSGGIRSTRSSTTNRPTDQSGTIAGGESDQSTMAKGTTSDRSATREVAVNNAPDGLATEGSRSPTSRAAAAAAAAAARGFSSTRRPRSDDTRLRKAVSSLPPSAPASGHANGTVGLPVNADFSTSGGAEDLTSTTGSVVGSTRDCDSTAECAVLVDIRGAPVVEKARGEQGAVNDATSLTPAKSGERERGLVGVGEHSLAKAVRTLYMEVLELQSQLADVRRAEAITRSAIRRLQEDVDALRERLKE